MKENDSLNTILDYIKNASEEELAEDITSLSEFTDPIYPSLIYDDDEDIDQIAEDFQDKCHKDYDWQFNNVNFRELYMFKAGYMMAKRKFNVDQ